MKRPLVPATILLLGLPLLANAGDLTDAGRKDPAPDPDKTFAERDGNRDGFLSREEFLAGASRDAEARAAFTRLDTDADGVLSRAEFTGRQAARAKDTTAKPSTADDKRETPAKARRSPNRDGKGAGKKGNRQPDKKRHQK